MAEGMRIANSKNCARDWSSTRSATSTARSELERSEGTVMRFQQRIQTFGLVLLIVHTAACSQVQPHLSLPTLEIGQPEFAATLVGYTGIPVVGSNQVDILLNGDNIFPAKLAAIRSAKKTINYADYVFEEGQPSSEIAQALAERCRAGVQVKVLLDAFGSLAMPGEYRATMVNAGCRVETFRPLGPLSLDRANNRNHRRILVVDGRLGLTGGSGTSGKWSGNGRMSGHWRDTDIRVEGPVVEQLQGAFAENWLEATGVAIGGKDYFPQPHGKGTVSVQAVRSSPAGGSAAMYTMFLLAMASAQRSISITNPYFVPEDKMIETLIVAARRGVRVRLLLPGEIDHNIVRQASRSELGQLLTAGIQIYEYRSGLLHAKTMVIDGVWATVGSTNLDRRSFALNDELNLVVYDATVARQMQQIFEADLQESSKVTFESWKRRGVFSQFIELLAIPIRDQL
jgi:cardiolipin synthase